MESTLTNLLLSCESNGTAPPYVVNPNTYKTGKSSLLYDSMPLWTEPVSYQSNKEDIFVVSDLHIASGRNAMGIYKGTENFFADGAFARFMEYVAKAKKTEQAILVINGDIFDFLRTTEYPGKVRKLTISKRINHFFKFGEVAQPIVAKTSNIVDEYKEWSAELKKCGIIKTPAELEASISVNEKKYGLETDDYKTIYKLIKIKHGHPTFFTALAQWLAKGNKIIIVKGNHDLEIYWPAVRNYIRLMLAELISKNDNTEQVLLQKVLLNITFVDDAISVDDTLFIEHGHRYDKYTMVLGNATLDKKPSQINIPFGSFFNRYLINVIELYHPNLDKVRPSGNILPILMKENFPLAIKVLFSHMPFMLRVLYTNPTYIWYMFRRMAWWFLIIIAPVTLIVIGILKNIKVIEQALSGSFFSFVKGSLGSISTLVLGYFGARIVAWFQLEEPSSLNDYAKKIFSDKRYKVVVMGHTHNPGAYSITPNCMFFNTGTWIPVIEISTAEVREDRTYTFLHLSWKDNELVAANNEMLQRWNDDALRPDPQILVERKG